MKHVLPGALVCLLAGLPAAAVGQTLGGLRPRIDVPYRLGAITGLHTVLQMVSLKGDAADRSVDWDGDLAAGVDLFNVGPMRGNVFINIETIVGRERRTVDPNHVSYTVDGTAAFRLPHGEVAAMFHHVSRHLSDRAFDESVSWNMIGGSYGDRLQLGPFELEAGARALITIESAGVDYDRQAEGWLHVVRPLRRRLALLGRVEGVLVPVDRTFDRSMRKGGRLEGGLRVTGVLGTFDAFLAWEQRIDAHLTDRATVRWLNLGVRLITTVP